MLVANFRIALWAYSREDTICEKQQLENATKQRGSDTRNMVVSEAVARKQKTDTYEDIFFVLFLDGGDDARGNHGLLPRFLQVEVEDSFARAVVYVRFHLRVAVLRSDVHLMNTTKSQVAELRGRFPSFFLQPGGRNRSRDLPQQRSC